jgi:hypothetical protein
MVVIFNLNESRPCTHGRLFEYGQGQECTDYEVGSAAPVEVHESEGSHLRSSLGANIFYRIGMEL